MRVLSDLMKNWKTNGILRALKPIFVLFKLSIGHRMNLLGKFIVNARKKSSSLAAPQKFYNLINRICELLNRFFLSDAIEHHSAYHLPIWKQSNQIQLANNQLSATFCFDWNVFVFVSVFACPLLRQAWNECMFCTARELSFYLEFMQFYSCCNGIGSAF